jgi:hypothetical protein
LDAAAAAAALVASAAPAPAPAPAALISFQFAPCCSDCPNSCPIQFQRMREMLQRMHCKS